ncbi:MAG: hypothetical protein AAF787_12390 [Chloroflexota bacterium]
MDKFSDFDAIEPEVYPAKRNETYSPRIAWYGDCILVGSHAGLRLYDPDQASSGVQLATINSRSISNIAVDLENEIIAFNVAQEPAIHFIHSNSDTSVWQVEEDAITDISFSPTGDYIAVSSADIGIDPPYSYDPNLQILDSELDVISTMSTDASAGVFVGSTFTVNEGNILVYVLRQGYIGNEIELWDINSASKLWDNTTLLQNMDKRSLNDPLAIERVATNGQIIALGGMDGYNFNEYYGTAIHIWDIESMNRISEIIIHRRNAGEDENRLVGLDLSSDGSKLAITQLNGQISLWDPIKGTIVAEYQPGTQNVPGLSFSPDNEKLALLYEDEIRILDSTELNQITTISLSDR